MTQEQVETINYLNSLKAQVYDYSVEAEKHQKAFQEIQNIINELNKKIEEEQNKKV